MAGTDWYPPLWDGRGVGVVADDTRSLFIWFRIAVTDCDWGEGTAWALVAACPANAGTVQTGAEGKTERKLRTKTRTFFTGISSPPGP